MILRSVRRAIALVGFGVPLLILAQAETTTQPEYLAALPEVPTSSEVPAQEPFGELEQGGYLVDRFEAREIYRSYLDNEQFDQAIDAARLGLQLTESLFGPSDLELVPYLNELGTAMAASGEHAGAQGVFARSIGIVEQEEGIFSATLVEPLVGMGLALQAMSEHDQAVQILQRAQHVTHRSDGVYSLDQIPIIEAQADSLMAQSHWTEAENLKLLSFKLYRRKYGDESLQTVPAMYRLARWYQDIRDYRQARLIYRRSVELQQETVGSESVDLIPGLQGIAGSYLKEDGADLNRGLRAYQQIVAIVEANSASVSQEFRALTQLELGDWYIRVNQERDAWEHYRRGWQYAQQDQSGERDWVAYFSKPQVIYSGAVLSMEMIGHQSQGKEAYYIFEFDVETDGRPRNISILDTNLHSQTRSPAVQAFRYARFRPAIVNGEVAATESFRLRRVYPTPTSVDFSHTSAAVSYSNQSHW